MYVVRNSGIFDGQDLGIPDNRSRQTRTTPQAVNIEKLDFIAGVSARPAYEQAGEGRIRNGFPEYDAVNRAEDWFSRGRQNV
jgi:hypothetical protein